MDRLLWGKLALNYAGRKPINANSVSQGQTEVAYSLTGGKMKKIVLVFVLFVLVSFTCYGESIRELGGRVNWNDSSGNPDFILTVRYKDNGVVFCPSFIVHPMSREEDFPKNMETVVINEEGLSERE